MRPLIITYKKSLWQRVKDFILFPFVWVVKKLLSLKAKLHLKSLRIAIGEADKDKATTNRKNMVVFNTSSNQYEAIQKKLLKKAATSKKQDPARNGYRVRQAVKRTKIKTGQVKKIEEKSLYVTK